MADKVCSKCNVGWEILDHDQFCGYCGCEAFGFSVKWEGNPLFYVGDTRELAILVENTGATPITFEPLQIESGDALTLSDTDKSFTVQSGKTHTTEVQVDPKKLKTEYPEKVSVRAKNAAPNQDSIKSLELQTLPLPEFTLKPNQVFLEYPKSRETETVAFQIKSQQVPFQIESIESSEPWINSVDLSKAPDTIRLEINCNQLEEGHNSKTLRFKLRGPSEPIEKKIQIQTKILPEPATLFVVPEENLEIIQDRETSHTIRLENTGGDPLTITNIILANTSDLVQLTDLEFPIIIEGKKEEEKETGKHQEIGISVSSINTPPGTYPINFTIISNCETAPEYQYTLNVTVKEREESPHYLTIDFGTTNSCCAYIDDNNNFALELIPLEERATDDTASPISDSTIMPSSIIYLTEPENGKDYDVGAKAIDARTDSRDGPYYISSVKRWLGYRWHRQFPNGEQLQPVDVVSHILKHIINKAEDYLEQQNIRSKIRRCTVTHPTKFNTSQQDALKQAFKKIGITEDNLKLIDEASAASIGIIVENYNSLPERLLVYDFGGGTIDIVLAQVTKEGSVITIEPIARDGDPKYGGDDVTQAIVKYVLDEYKRKIEEISPRHNLDIPYFDPGQILQPSEYPDSDNAKRNNSATLYQRAEEMKRELSNQPETEFTVELNVVDLAGNSVETISKFVEKILKQQSQAESALMEQIQDIVRVKLSADQFQTFIEPALNKTFAMIDTMIADNGEHLPDLVVLAGQSSKMPFVKRMMSEHFKNKYQKNIEIRLDDNPKTCVVMGAAEYSRRYTVPYVENEVLKINFPNKTHTRIGIKRIHRGGVAVFTEIIPKGALIPEESFNTIEFPLISQQATIDVCEHFGSGDTLDENQVSQIYNYVLNITEHIPEEVLRTAKLKMALELNGEIKLTAIVGDHEEPFIVKREEPEFVYEIPRTTPIINTVTPQTISPYQRETEAALQDARQRVMKLARNYRGGEPINLDNIFPSTPIQKLNSIARDLCEWTSELKQSGQTDLLQTLRHAEKGIKDELKTIRGEDIPSPKTLNLSTDVSTDAEVNRIRNACAEYVNTFESTLRNYELDREVDSSICEQFIRNRLFNNLSQFMSSDTVPEKLDKFLQLVDLKIVSIKISETEADSRVHDIQDSKQTDVKRGTIAEVIKPGLMKTIDGAIVQKPVVIRGE